MGSPIPRFRFCIIQVPKGKRIATPVCALVRNDTIFYIAVSFFHRCQTSCARVTTCAEHCAAVRVGQHDANLHQCITALNHHGAERDEKLSEPIEGVEPAVFAVIGVLAEALHGQDGVTDHKAYAADGKKQCAEACAARQ